MTSRALTIVALWLLGTTLSIFVALAVIAAWNVDHKLFGAATSVIIAVGPSIAVVAGLKSWLAEAASRREATRDAADLAFVQHLVGRFAAAGNAESLGAVRAAIAVQGSRKLVAAVAAWNTTFSGARKALDPTTGIATIHPDDLAALKKATAEVAAAARSDRKQPIATEELGRLLFDD